VDLDLESDTREELEAEAAILYQARQILAARFSRDHQQTAVEVRRAAVRLTERAWHPSRSVPPPDPEKA
jgi:hypothetical protein